MAGPKGTGSTLFGGIPLNALKTLLPQQKNQPHLIFNLFLIKSREGSVLPMHFEKEHKLFFVCFQALEPERS